MWGQRIHDPGPLHVKAHDLCRGGIMPRTHHGGLGRLKEMAEDDLMLGVP